MDQPRGTETFVNDSSAARRRYGELREGLMEEVNDFAGEHEISPGALSLLLVDLGLTSYMLGYFYKTDKPSSLGLKLELDRFNRDVGDFIRSSKRDAEEFVREAKKILASAPAEDEPSAEK